MGHVQFPYLFQMWPATLAPQELQDAVGLHILSQRKSGEMDEAFCWRTSLGDLGAF